MSDGRFAALGGNRSTSAFEALTRNDGVHWQSLSSMHEAREYLACAAVVGSIIVAGGIDH